MPKSPLSKTRRLHQTNEAWECSARRMRSWITPRNQDPYRPYIIIVVSSQTGQVVGTTVIKDVPSPDRVLSTLARAMRRPGLWAGKKRRPAAIHIDDKSLVKALRPHLHEVGIRCDYRHTLREIEQALRSMEQFKNKEEPMPGLLKSRGVTPRLAGGLFEAAASYYRQAPWRWIDDSRPIEVCYPPDSRPYYAVVMGHGGETFGLAVYNSPDDLRKLYTGRPKKSFGQQEWTSLIFVEMLEMPFDDLDDMEKYGWPVAGKLAYPFPIRVTRSEQLIRPGKSKLLWFEAALLAIPTFVRDYMQIEVDRGIGRPAEATLPVTMVDAKDSIRLRYPVAGFEIPYEMD